MKRLQIMIEEDLDDLLAFEALRQRTSKAALIRRYVREAVGPMPERDALEDMIGVDDYAEPGPDSRYVDDVVYPR